MERKEHMKPIKKSALFTMHGMALVAAFIALFTISWSIPAIAAETQRLFSSPENALKTFTDAVSTNDETALNEIFGPVWKDIHSGDKVKDKIEFAELYKNLREKSTLIYLNDSKVTLQIGNENWPFPIPLIKNKHNSWFFDTETGKEEILNRRIGENELTAILVCRSYVNAQREYVLKDWDGDGIFAYAQKLRSDRGKRNGLYWRTEPGQEISPLGELVAKAWHEGYKKKMAAFREEEPAPFHGYYFRILTGQGKNAPGGSYSYIINGNMVGGFGLVAFPSSWGKSGVMTFVVNQQGKVYQKNLGPNTIKIAEKMESYNPDKTWALVKE